MDSRTKKKLLGKAALLMHLIQEHHGAIPAGADYGDILREGISAALALGLPMVAQQQVLRKNKRLQEIVRDLSFADEPFSVSENWPMSVESVSTVEGEPVSVPSCWPAEKKDGEPLRVGWGGCAVTAYYNENNPQAAAWLRELIKAGHIADGDVDERSITEVDAVDVAGYTQCHFFAGIGGWSYALRLAGWPDDKPVWTGSCPCQPFSTAGKRRGFADERHLWPAFYALIRERRPVTVFGEQVASKGGLSWLNLVRYDLERAGYICGAVDTCAAGFGAPHIRQRLYWVADTSSYTGHKRCGLESHRRQDNAEQNGLGSRADWMANAASQQDHKEQQRPAADEGGRSADGVGGCCMDSRMADTDSFGCQCQSNIGCSSVQRTAYATDEPRQQPCPHGSSPCGLANASPGPTNGHWRDADWLYCRDGKWRPVEPGTFPLAHGLPARVVRLRGYGNAIVPQVAAAFVSAFMEVNP